MFGFIAFLVLLGGTYALAHAAGASFGLATGLAWVVALSVPAWRWLKRLPRDSKF
jgi:hypothetical protein